MDIEWAKDRVGLYCSESSSWKDKRVSEVGLGMISIVRGNSCYRFNKSDWDPIKKRQLP
jgi:hypothetical protein